jgi:hypothetical protein
VIITSIWVLRCDAALFQFDDQRFLIIRLEKTRPETPVYLDRRPNDLRSQRFVFQSYFSVSCLPGFLIQPFYPSVFGMGRRRSYQGETSRNKARRNAQVDQGQIFISPG